MIYKIKKKIAFAIRMINEGNLKNVWKALVRRIKSEEVAYGFRRDLDVRFAKPRTLLKINVRVYQSGDEHFFKDRKNDGLINDFKTCYIGVTGEGIPCSHLWLIDASQNEKLKKAWGNTFPTLGKDELLVENVYTVPKYRGLGVFPTFLDQIVEKGMALGAKSIISFGEASNVNMSRSFTYAGFQPYIVRRKKWFLFCKSVKFEKLTEKELKLFNQQTAAYWAKSL